jgi:hypothetical protein
MDALVRCPRCWKRGPGAARFCRRCGCALARSVPPPLPASAPSAPGRGRGAGLLLRLVVLCAFAMAGLLIFGSLTHSGVSVSVPATPRAAPVNSSDTADVSVPSTAYDDPVEPMPSPSVMREWPSPPYTPRGQDFPGTPGYTSVQRGTGKIPPRYIHIYPPGVPGYMLPPPVNGHPSDSQQYDGKHK